MFWADGYINEGADRGVKYIKKDIEKYITKYSKRYFTKIIQILLILTFVGSAVFTASGSDEKLPDYVAEKLTADQRAVRLTEYENQEIPEVYLIESGGETQSLIQHVSSQGYNGEIQILVTISPADQIITDIGILQHRETPDYGGHLSSSWFLQRFVGKEVGKELVLVKLFNRNPEEVVAITGATRTSQGMVAGVNKAFDNYNKLQEVLNNEK